MLKEWYNAIKIFIIQGYATIGKDVNNQPFPRQSKFGFHIFFLSISILCAIILPRGIPEEFIDYIKDIFSIFIGFFVTALVFIYDKLNIEKIPSQEEIDNMSVDKRPSSNDRIRMIQEYNYAIRFLYSIGFNILYATLTLLLLIPVIFWNGFFSMDISEYKFVHHLADLDSNTVLLGAHIAFLFTYRLIVIYMTLKVFFFTVYMITSLLQVLISKKKI